MERVRPPQSAHTPTFEGGLSTRLRRPGAGNRLEVPLVLQPLEKLLRTVSAESGGGVTRMIAPKSSCHVPDSRSTRTIGSEVDRRRARRMLAKCAGLRLGELGRCLTPAVRVVWRGGQSRLREECNRAAQDTDRDEIPHVILPLCQSETPPTHVSNITIARRARRRPWRHLTSSRSQRRHEPGRGAGLLGARCLRGRRRELSGTTPCRTRRWRATRSQGVGGGRS
jgi:hypothetical protein